jgi:hypothetical protein
MRRASRVLLSIYFGIFRFLFIKFKDFYKVIKVLESFYKVIKRIPLYYLRIIK